MSRVPYDRYGSETVDALIEQKILLSPTSRHLHHYEYTLEES
jgi:hypothetical protein